MNPNQPNPKLIWDLLPEDVKLKILGFLEPDDLASFKQSDKAAHALAEQLRVTHCVKILDRKIAAMRAYMKEGALTKETVPTARLAWAKLKAAVDDVADNVGIDSDRWAALTDDTSVYFPLRARGTSVDQIDDWYYKHLE